MAKKVRDGAPWRKIMGILRCRKDKVETAASTSLGEDERAFWLSSALSLERLSSVFLVA